MRFGTYPKSLVPPAFARAQLDNVRPRALRGDSSGLPGVPRGKDGAGREEKRITLARIFNNVLSVRAGYRRLVVALLEASKARTADSVCLLLQSDEWREAT
ncbi:hypothetical protein PHYPO_G00181400 [Pangasianodon hypophthalmus]|uniref:Uncharacterized protein n=1 Tax=Pangasianodon hypophthalmus TaxID=310915 RepID=A0A5N5PQH1_PANHP|nr:hypothetical protein PHYPO_G00181400 [Pangasianodon hypophthalmus]